MIYLTSDLHIGHLNCLKLMPTRPWATIDEMNDALIDNYNRVVQPTDTVIILGDLIMGKKFENVPRFLPLLQGYKRLVVGNHDFLPSECSVSKLNNMERLYENNGIQKIYYGTIRLSTITGDSKHDNIFLSHFPTESTNDPRDNEYERRYVELMPVIKEDEFLLHGHTHAAEHLTSQNIYHVGIDATIHNYSPVSLDLILSRL